MWSSLHLHSQYSLLDSTLSIDSIATKAKEYGMKAVALTDSGNLFGAVDFFKSCKASGIIPIIGCEIAMAPSSRHEKKKALQGSSFAFPLVLLAKNKKGYQNLSFLSSMGFIEGFYYVPRIDKELLASHSEGLICLSGPLKGKIASLVLQGAEKELLEEIVWYQQLFREDFYFEVQRHPMMEENIQKEMGGESWQIKNLQDFVKGEEIVLQKLQDLSQKMGIRCVVTQDSHYLHREDWRAHEILLNIQSGEPCELVEWGVNGERKNTSPNPKRKTYPSHEFYFKSPEEMQLLFADMPAALSATEEIVDKCSFSFDFHKKHYPLFTPPSLEGKKVSKEERKKEAEAFLYGLCTQAIDKRYPPEVLQYVAKKYPGRDPKEVVRERLEYEFSIIASKEMADYLLIVHDFISWAKKNKIPVGPGRGSVVGSILAYLIEITDIEPLRFSLFFERFINPERLSYPDIDVDICMDRRGEVIEYTLKKYGKEKIAQIITFGTMKAKMAIRDVARVLSIPLAKVNAIAKLVPEDPSMTLEKALQLDVELKKLYDQDPEARRVIDEAKKIEGSIRNTSTHAAGLIISASPIIEHIPICTAKDSSLFVTQFSMKPVEAVGMLKIDFLGLKTLTSLQKAESFIEKNFSESIDWTKLPLDDKKTFALLNEGRTLGVFQLEMGGMHELAVQLHIDNFEEIIAVVALYRPGPMNMIPSFIQRKQGRESIEIDHPLMKEILAETYGVMVYQEQVMQIASHLAGYSLSEGDVLRKAMGKKDHKEMSKQRQKFLEGAQAKGIDKETAIKIFDRMEKFSLYGFNKSHAAAYAYLSYATAYFKAHYPKEWMAALMTSDRDDLTKVAKYLRECSSLSIPVLPPDVNEAGKEFFPVAKGIRFALSGIKGVGEGVVDTIVKEREKKGLFRSLYDFVQRMDTSRIGKKAIELLIESGAFDFTLWTRKGMKESLDTFYAQAAKEQKDLARGEMSLFSSQEQEPLLSPPSSAEEDKEILLKREKELLGFYLTGHPLENYQTKLQELRFTPLKELEQKELGALCRIAFVIEEVESKISSKNQKKFAILAISDGMERYELPIWPELYEERIALLEENRLLGALVHVEKEGERVKLQCRFLEDLAKVDEEVLQEEEKIHSTGLVARKKSFAPKENRNFFSKASISEKTLFSFRLNADRLRFSHILSLKKLFQEKRGNFPIEIHFYSQDDKIFSLEIPAERGVSVDTEFRKRLENFFS